MDVVLNSIRALASGPIGTQGISVNRKDWEGFGNTAHVLLESARRDRHLLCFQGRSGDFYDDNDVGNLCFTVRVR